MEITLLNNIRTNFKIYNNYSRKAFAEKLVQTGIAQYPAEALLDKLIEYLNAFPELITNVGKDDNDYYDSVKIKIEVMFLAVSLNEGITATEQKKCIDIFKKSYKSSNFNIQEFIETIDSAGFYNTELVKKISLDSLKLGIGGTRTEVNDLELESSKRLLLSAFDISTLINYEILARVTEYLKKKQVELALPTQMSLSRMYSKEELDFIFEQWKEFKKISNKTYEDVSNITIQNGKVMLHEGDLLHGIGRFGYKTLESIAKTGIIASEFLGATEDNQNFASADFYRVDKDKSLEEELKEINGFENKFPKKSKNSSDRVAFIIQKNNLDRCKNLTDYDSYLDTEKGKIARKISGCKLQLSKAKASSIIIGLPASVISMIVVDENLEQNEEKINFLLEKFPNAVIVSTIGNIITQKEREKTLEEKGNFFKEKFEKLRKVKSKLTKKI